MGGRALLRKDEILGVGGESCLKEVREELGYGDLKWPFLPGGWP